MRGNEDPLSSSGGQEVLRGRDRGDESPNQDLPNTVIEARQEISYLRTLTEMFGDLHLAGDYIIIFTVRRKASDVLCSSSVQGHISNNFNNYLILKNDVINL